MKPEELQRMLARASRSVQKLNEELARECPGTIEPKLDVPKVTRKKRIRQSSKPLLNKLETDFKEWYERSTGYTLTCQAIRFRLGNSIWYKPDFTHLNDIGNMTCIEVKGPHAFRGGFENLKVAAGLYPQFTWRLWWKENGQWQHQCILP